MAPVGAHSAPTTFSARPGCFVSACSRLKISSPGTPFFTPFSYSLRTVAMSTSSKASTSEPMRLSGTFNSRHHSSNIAFPATLTRAMTVPGSQSYPAWTMAEFARDAPMATSAPASSTATRTL